MHDLLLLSAAICYLGAMISLYRSLPEHDSKPRTLAIALTTLGVVLHTGAQFLHWSIGPATEISFLNVMSLCALVVVALLLLSLAFRNDVFEAGLVALPLAILVVLGEWLVPAPGSLLENASTATAWHVISSVMSFGVLSIAGVYAVFVALIDHFLRHHQMNQLVRALPALDTLETLLFRLITLGFVLLTLSLLTGLLFVDDLFAQHLAHKTILSLLAWVVFGVLLLGRRLWGWRGRTAVRMTIAGVVLLLLAYFGSKFVLEVLLGRDWQS